MKNKNEDGLRFSVHHLTLRVMQLLLLKNGMVNVHKDLIKKSWRI